MLPAIFLSGTYVLAGIIKAWRVAVRCTKTRPGRLVEERPASPTQPLQFCGPTGRDRAQCPYWVRALLIINQMTQPRPDSTVLESELE